MAGPKGWMLALALAAPGTGCGEAPEGLGAAEVVAIAFEDDPVGTLSDEVSLDLFRDLFGTAPGTVVTLDAPDRMVRTIVEPYAAHAEVPLVQLATPMLSSIDREAHRLVRLERGHGIDPASFPDHAPPLELSLPRQREALALELARRVDGAAAPVAVVLPEGVWTALRPTLDEAGWTLAAPTRSPGLGKVDAEVRRLDLAILAKNIEGARQLPPTELESMVEIVQRPGATFHPPFEQDPQRLLLAARLLRRAGRLAQATAHLDLAEPHVAPEDAAPDAPGDWRSAFSLAQAVRLERALVARDAGRPEEAREVFDALLAELPGEQPRSEVPGGLTEILVDTQFLAGEPRLDGRGGWGPSGSEADWTWSRIDGGQGLLRAAPTEAGPLRVEQRVPIPWHLLDSPSARFQVYLRTPGELAVAELFVSYQTGGTRTRVATRGVEVSGEWLPHAINVPVGLEHDEVVVGVQVEGTTIELTAGSLWREPPSRPNRAWRPVVLARAWLREGTIP